MGLSSAGLMFVITGGIALVACVLAGIYVYLYLTQMKPREDVMRKHARPKASVSKLVSRRCVLNRDPMAPTPQGSVDAGAVALPLELQLRRDDSIPYIDEVDGVMEYRLESASSCV